MKLDFFIRKNTWLNGIEHGWGNGYVELPKRHPMYGKEYTDIDVSVHGGLTYSKQEGDSWVVGFDTAHAGDNLQNWPESRVMDETRKLRDQLANMKG